MNDKNAEFEDLIENIYEDIKSKLLLKVHYQGETLVEMRDYLINNKNTFYGWAKTDFWRILIEDTIRDLIYGEYDYLEF